MFMYKSVVLAYLTVLWLQNDFLSPEASLFVAGGPAVVPAVVKAVEIARAKGALVVWVPLLTHFMLD